jgi:hypothetical protein
MTINELGDKHSSWLLVRTWFVWHLLLAHYRLIVQQDVGEDQVAHHATPSLLMYMTKGNPPIQLHTIVPHES